MISAWRLLAPSGYCFSCRVEPELVYYFSMDFRNCLSKTAIFLKFQTYRSKTSLFFGVSDLQVENFLVFWSFRLISRKLTYFLKFQTYRSKTIDIFEQSNKTEQTAQNIDVRSVLHLQPFLFGVFLVNPARYLTAYANVFFAVRNFNSAVYLLGAPKVICSADFFLFFLCC